MKNFLICLLLLTTSLLSAQLNPKHMFVNGQSDVLAQVNIKSTHVPQVVVLPSISTDSLSVTFASTGNYTLSALPNVGFTGETDLVIEYYEPSPFPGISFPNYTTVHYRFKSSIVNGVDDNFLVNQDSVILDVLLNDTNSNGDLTIDRIGYVEGGSAQISNNKIAFQLNASADEAFVRYFVSDTLSNTESGTVHIVREDSTLVDSKNVYADNKSPIRLSLSSSNYAVQTAPAHGSVSNGVDPHVWYYESDIDYVGLDTVVFSTLNGGSITYSIDVLNKGSNNYLVQDDEYFIETDGSLSFNVFDNDYRDNRTIIDYSSDITYLGNGEFTYDAPTGFTGDKVFYYKVFTGLAIQTANIIIHVDNFAPTTDVSYEFDILKDHDLKIVHDTPLSTYTYSVAVSPSYGSVIVVDNGGSEVLECATITGDNTIIYTPNPGFNGLDEFDLEYCTDQGQCEIVKIDVQVLDTNFDDCLCLNSCVYSGDTNDDGVVDMKDILDMALNLGQSGFDRDNDFNLIWTGQESDDWGYNQMNAGIDLKCSDADGDGYIDYNDFSDVYDNYGQVHKLVSDEYAVTSQVPIYFIPPSNPVDSGEWISLDIVIGSSGQPAIDFYGSSFTLNINPDIIDSSSVVFTPYYDSWLGYESPLESMYSVPKDGQVDIGITRINNISADGIGVIGTLEFIIEDEIEGFKRSSLIEQSSLVTMNNIISTNEFGEYHIHPVFSDEIQLSQDGRFDEDDLNQSITAFPNPTTGFLTIESDKYSIDKIEFIDALGRLVHMTYGSDTKTYNLDISSFNQGTYFVRISSNDRTTVKKIQKID